MKPKWTAGKCCVAECEMSLVMPIGAGRHLCWLHAIKFGLPLALVAMTAACSTDIFVSVEGGISINPDSGAEEAGRSDAPDDSAAPDGDAATIGDAATDAFDAADSSDACATVWGPSACDAIMDNFCAALYTKCGGQTVMQCRAWWASNFAADYDCTVNKFKKSVCSGDANQCAGTEIPSYTCGKLMSSTPAQLGGSCATFFGEF